MRRMLMMDIVRNNLMTQLGYAPYCGSDPCTSFRRSRFDGEQFVCPHCGWRSQFPDDFIFEYKAKWHELHNVELTGLRRFWRRSG
jgi:predicted RNA-binding Zn-ribbon protein involved in translation (DUF1610 family)